MKYIIFDYNGTLVNDLDLSINALNGCISKYLDRKPVELEEYHSVFTMPVENYYRALGFTFTEHSFAEVGKYWHEYYTSNFTKEAKLFDDVIETLQYTHSKGYMNIVLSACETKQLNSELEMLGIRKYFDEVIGVNSIYGISKLDEAIAFRKKHPEDEMLMIGDTLHDFEVADKMGISGVFVARGHQPSYRLKEAETKIYDSLKEVEYDKNWSK